MSKESFASYPNTDLSRAKLSPDSIGGRSILQHYEEIFRLRDVRDRLDEHRDLETVQSNTSFNSFLMRERVIFAHRNAINAIVGEFKPDSFIERRIHPFRIAVRKTASVIHEVKEIIAMGIPHRLKSS